VRDACVPFADLWPLYFKPGCSAFADGLEKYLDADDADDPHMEHAPVNTDFLESTFGTLDYLNKACHGVDIWSNFGQALALKTGIFLSYEKRVRTLNSKRDALGLPPHADAEAFDIVTKSPMYLLENMNDEEFENVYASCRKMTSPTFKKIRADKKVQLAADLERKQEQVREQERREMKALQRFKDRENFEVFTTMGDLLDVLKSKHPTGSAKFTPLMKCEIVVAQLQYRRDCLGRVLAPGCMCSNYKGTAESKLRALLQNFKACIKDEARIPALLRPPTIRRK